jgi:hypothetical protein
MLIEQSEWISPFCTQIAHETEKGVLREVATRNGFPKRKSCLTGGALLLAAERPIIARLALVPGGWREAHRLEHFHHHHHRTEK